MKKTGKRKEELSSVRSVRKLAVIPVPIGVSIPQAFATARFIRKQMIQHLILDMSIFVFPSLVPAERTCSGLYFMWWITEVGGVVVSRSILAKNSKYLSLESKRV